VVPASPCPLSGIYKPYLDPRIAAASTAAVFLGQVDRRQGSRGPFLIAATDAPQRSLEDEARSFETPEILATAAKSATQGTLRQRGS
jgi:hypothetical protein